jgi:hypothetical protein
MRNTFVRVALFALVVAATIVGVVIQRRIRARLHEEANDLRRSNAAMASAREEIRQPIEISSSAVSEQPSPAGAAASDNAPPATVVNRDPTAGMVNVEQLDFAGQSTPAAAFQTLHWAALHGRDDVLAETLAVSDSARAKLGELRSRMEATTRQKFPTPESIPALLLAEEVLRKALSFQISNVEHSGGDVATLTVRTTSRTGLTSTSRFTMRQVNGKWCCALEDELIDAMIRSLGRADAPEPERP